MNDASNRVSCWGHSNALKICDLLLEVKCWFSDVWRWWEVLMFKEIQSYFPIYLCRYWRHTLLQDEMFGFLCVTNTFLMYSSAVEQYCWDCVGFVCRGLIGAEVGGQAFILEFIVALQPPACRSADGRPSTCRCGKEESTGAPDRGKTMYSHPLCNALSGRHWWRQISACLVCPTAHRLHIHTDCNVTQQLHSQVKIISFHFNIINDLTWLIF